MSKSSDVENFLQVTEANHQHHVGIPRLETGVQRLDFILKGGLLEGGTYLLMGPPGSGKTVLANQICFHQTVKCGHTAVYMTMLSETHGRMIQHIQSMSFFDSKILEESFQFVNGYHILERDGVSGLHALLQDSLKRYKPRVIVIDGVEAIEAGSRSPTEFKKFIAELQVLATFFKCAMLLLYPTQADSNSPERTMVDGVIELSHQTIGPRAVRELIVQKFRGSEYLMGKHEVAITREGIVIHPRTEVQFANPPEKAQEDRESMKFGITEFDKMLNGGILSGSTTMIVGAPGTGKTVLGLQFLAQGAKEGQAGVYFGFDETPPRLIEKAEKLGIPLARYCEQGLIEIQWQPALETNLDGLAERLLERLRTRRQTSSRMRAFIDGIGGFRTALVYPERMPRFMAALAHQLRAMDITALLAEETDLFKSEVSLPTPGTSTIVENIVLLRYVELRSQIHRLISIMKMRESAYDSSIREFKIDQKGIEVASSFQSAEAVLSGLARDGKEGR